MLVNKLHQLCTEAGKEEHKGVTTVCCFSEIRLKFSGFYISGWEAVLQNRFQESTKDGMGEIINSVARMERTVKTVDQNTLFVWRCETDSPSLIGSPN